MLQLSDFIIQEEFLKSWEAYGQDTMVVMSIWLGCLHARYFSDLNAHILYVPDSVNEENTATICGEALIRMGKAELLYCFETWLGLIHFYASQQILTP